MTNVMSTHSPHIKGDVITYNPSLDATASLLFAQISPKASLKATIEDLSESGFVLPCATDEALALYDQFITDERGARAITARGIVQLLTLPVRLNTQQVIRHILPEVSLLDNQC